MLAAQATEKAEAATQVAAQKVVALRKATEKARAASDALKREKALASASKRYAHDLEGIQARLQGQVARAHAEAGQQQRAMQGQLHAYE